MHHDDAVRNDAPAHDDVAAVLAARRSELFDPATPGVERWSAPLGHRDAIGGRLAAHLAARGVSDLIALDPSGVARQVHVSDADLLGAPPWTMLADRTGDWLVGIDRGGLVVTLGSLLEEFNPYRYETPGALS